MLESFQTMPQRVTVFSETTLRLLLGAIWGEAKYDESAFLGAHATYIEFVKLVFQAHGIHENNCGHWSPITTGQF